jgi:hypothetical protein
MFEKKLFSFSYNIKYIVVIVVEILKNKGKKYMKLSFILKCIMFSSIFCLRFTLLQIQLSSLVWMLVQNYDLYVWHKLFFFFFLRFDFVVIMATNVNFKVHYHKMFLYYNVSFFLHQTFVNIFCYLNIFTNFDLHITMWNFLHWLLLKTNSTIFNVESNTLKFLE